METSVVPPAAFERAVASAGSVTLAAYTLPSPGLVAALECAAARGALVAVVLAGGAKLPAGLRARNARAAATLRAHGVGVRIETAAVHAKAAVVDGDLYLDGRNWNRGDLIVRDRDPADVAAFRDALAGAPGRPGPLATSKAAALAQETALIAGAVGDRIDVASESFGGCTVSKALHDRLAAGARVRLLVSSEELRGPNAAREWTTLRKLAAAGAEIRTSRANDKLCVAAGRAWLGSANATWPVGPMLDWGLVSDDSALVGAARTRFETDWAAARPLPQADARVVA